MTVDQHTVLKYRLAGWTPRRIADDTGMTLAEVEGAVAAMLDDVATADLPALRALHYLRLERLVMLLAPKADGGDMAALSLLLKVTAEEAKVLGLYPAHRYEVTDGSERPISDAVLAEIEALARQVADA